MDYKKYCIESTRNLRSAMKQLDETSKKILFVVESGKLVATLTDGDLRRFLLRGGTMDDPVIAASFKSPHSARTVEEALPLLKNVQYAAIPIVNSNNEIIDILFANEPHIISCPKLSLPVVIMAGGKGTRLDPYTRILPKPLIPVGELPIIEHIMQQFGKYDCNEFHVIVNHKKQLIKTYFSENECQYNTVWHDEDKPLGTGGGLSLLKNDISTTFFLTNCDILLLAKYDGMLRFHRENKNAVTMVCALKNITIPYGVIETGENGRILSMKEKPEFSFQTNTGMYIVEPYVLDDIKTGTPIDFPDIIEMQKQKGRQVAAYPVSENDWLDMGQLAELERMRERLYGK